MAVHIIAANCWLGLKEMGADLKEIERRVRQNDDCAARLDLMDETMDLGEGDEEAIGAQIEKIKVEM